MQLLVNTDSLLLQIYPGSKIIPHKPAVGVCVCVSLLLGLNHCSSAIKAYQTPVELPSGGGSLLSPPPGRLWVAVTAHHCPLSSCRWPPPAPGHKGRKVLAAWRLLKTSQSNSILSNAALITGAWGAQVFALIMALAHFAAASFNLADGSLPPGQGTFLFYKEMSCNDNCDTFLCLVKSTLQTTLCSVTVYLRTEQ